MTTTRRPGPRATAGPGPVGDDAAGSSVPSAGPGTELGVPADAVAFYAELEDHNDRHWWAANKARYLASVRDPVTAVVEALAAEFGDPRVFRPQRDTRFSHDKSPYKTQQDAVLRTEGTAAYLLRIGADGLVTGGGYYHPAPDQVARYRAAVDGEVTGPLLARLVESLRGNGFEVHGEVVRTRPRGIPADHPRLELMRHQSLIVIKHHGTPGWMADPAVVDHVRTSFEQVRPLCEWLADHVGPSEVEQGSGRWGRR